MPQVGGSAKECSIDGNIFAIAADADVKMKMGGTSNERAANGNGTSRLIKNAEAGGFSGLKIAINHDAGDPQTLKEIADKPEWVDITVTFADDSTYQCSGQIEELPEISSKDATAELTIVADGEVTKQ